MNLENLRAGSWLFARGEEGRAIPLRLATLFRTRGSDKTYGLVARASGKHNYKTIYGNKDLSVGELLGDLTEADILPSDDTINSLFSIFRLDPKFSTQLRKVSYSKHLINNAFGPRPMRLRQAPKTELGTKNAANQKHLVFGPKGQLIGDVRRAQLKVGNSFVTLDRGGLAKSFGKPALCADRRQRRTNNVRQQATRFGWFRSRSVRRRRSPLPSRRRSRRSPQPRIHGTGPSRSTTV